MIIEMIGVPGSGKTTIATEISKSKKIQLYKELDIDNPFLNYRTYPDATLERSLFFMLNRLRVEHLELTTPIIYDGSMLLDLCYAQIELSGAELSLFDQLYKLKAKQKSLIIWIDGDVDRFYNRACDRDGENVLSREVHSNLHTSIAKNMLNVEKDTVIKILDFGQRQDEIQLQVENELRKFGL